VDNKGRLNLWRGFAMEPTSGDWGLMQRHVYRVLAQRDRDSFKYIMRWAAWTVQNPGIPARAVLSFRGKPGVGKGVFLRGLVWIFGQHGFHTSSPGHVYGRFNDHLRDCCFLFADEALAPEDSTSVSKMKALITEPTLPVEGKGKKIVQSPNCLHIAMASNADWSAPVEKDDRRYAVFDAKLDIIDKVERKAYFEALYAEQRNGGRAAMLHDLLAMDLGDWSPEEIPDTDARDEMKLLGRSPYYDPVREVLGDVTDGRMLIGETRKLLPSREPDEYERKHEKMLAAAMRELGWERKKVRADGKLGWFYAIGNPQQCEYVVRREPRALGRGAKVDVVKKGNEGGSPPTGEGGSRNGTPFG